jgi:phospholipase/lecithinase/hemolysin
VVDASALFDELIASPAKFGLSNVKTPACPVTGTGSDGLPSYTFPTCSDAALSAAPPAGSPGGANWWGTYLFSDGFHPTPFGHQLLAQSIASALAKAGWLRI